MISEAAFADVAHACPATTGLQAPNVTAVPTCVPAPAGQPAAVTALGAQRKNVIVPVGVGADPPAPVPEMSARSVIGGCRPKNPGALRRRRRHRDTTLSERAAGEVEQRRSQRRRRPRVAEEGVEALASRDLTRSGSGRPRRTAPCRRVWPTPSVLFAVSHGVVIVPVFAVRRSGRPCRQ